MNSILVVDDEPAVRALTARWLEAIGFLARAAASAEQALDVMATDSAGVVVCDVRMPGHDGLWLAEQLRSRYPETAVIMATGGQDLDAAVASLRLGVLDYLVKPFSRERLRESVERGVDWHRAALEVRRQRDVLQSQARIRHSQLSRALSGLRIESTDAVDAVLILLTLRDRGAYDHAHRVARLAQRVAAASNAPASAFESLEAAALLHELGRLALPDDLAHKVAPMSPDERELVREHPRFAFEVLRPVAALAGAATLVGALHERYDGTGYPNGLRGEAIPFASRVLAVADAFDMLSSIDGVPPQVARADAVGELSRQAGTRFDPELLRVLEALVLVQ
jgi:response regulator RpfG family c-di-GMP phosphodiesterase